MEAPLVYAIGLDPLMARAIDADLKTATIRQRPPPHGGEVLPCSGRLPDLILLNLGSADLEAELEAAWAAWGENTPVVGLDPCSPFARIWQRRERVRLVEIGPGFLQPLLRGG